MNMVTEIEDPRLNICRTNIRVAIAMRGLSQAEAARRAGLSRNTLSQFTAGQSVLTYANILRICDVLEIPIGVLHLEDGVTAARMRLHRALERLPDHLAAQVLESVTKGD